jgi:hypothetical protein
MRFEQMLLQEGRKEDLMKKYSSKFNEYEDTLTNILENPDLANTNFKYADFILKNLHPNSSVEEIEDSIKLVKEFDRYQSQLEKKDINQYKNFNELENTLLTYSSKSKEKKNESGADKIYEDDNILVVKPLTHSASCKYGAGTRWCTTQENDRYFKNYTEEGQALYYIIFKNIDMSNKYYKVAIHKKGDFEEFFDAEDTSMADNEISVFKTLVPNMIKKVEEDYKEHLKKSSASEFMKKVFDMHNPYRETKEFKNFNGYGNTLLISFDNSSTDSDNPNHATIDVSIYLSGNIPYELIDEYRCYIVYQETLEFIQLYPYYDDSHYSYNPVVDLGLTHLRQDGKVRNSISTRVVYKNICTLLSKQIKDFIISNKSLNEYIDNNTSSEPVWRPSTQEGYIFSKNKGLIKKMVDYLDADNLNGTKIDFLVHSQKVKPKKDESGNIIYVNKDGNKIIISTYFSSFFASAASAGIIKYEKEGRRFIIKKGPNFEAFKEGKLKAIR